MNNLAIGLTAKHSELMKPATRASSLKVAHPEEIMESRLLFSLAGFLGRIWNCILIVSITKPRHLPTCIGSNVDFSLFSFSPLSFKSF